MDQTWKKKAQIAKEARTLGMELQGQAEEFCTLADRPSLDRFQAHAIACSRAISLEYERQYLMSASSELTGANLITVIDQIYQNFRT